MIFDENSIRNVIKNLNDFGVRRADPEDFQWSRGGPMLRTFCKNRLYVWLFWVGHFDHLSNGFWRFFRDFIIDQFCRSRKNDRFPLDRWPFLDVNVVNAISFCIFFKKTSWSHLAQSGFSSGYTSIPNGRSIRVLKNEKDMLVDERGRQISAGAHWAHPLKTKVFDSRPAFLTAHRNRYTGRSNSMRAKAF